MHNSERCYQIFLDAADLPPADQLTLIERECGPNLELRLAVESLLTADRNNAASGGWLEPDSQSSELTEPDHIGPYQLLGRLGAGGMGAVYLAQRADGHDDQRVALKLINAGMFSSEMRARFLRERKMLATLDHPAIARLLDAGIAEGQQPYLVLEFVEGVPIDRYCEEKRLDVRDRLGLFLQVCAAVQEAHRKLVIHRDIKPANILVTASGQPKLLDFGIAKMLALDGADTQDSSRTAMLFTPNFASPEQVRGEAMGVGTDIYSLGVLLYQLLSGELPLRTDKASLIEAARLVQEQDPRAPSEAIADPTVRQAVRGDLDAIVLHALQKDSRNRYASVEAFAADVQRHLDGFPVQARGESLQYRAVKYLRRHRNAAIAAALLILAAAGGVVAIVRSAQIANQQRALAERRFTDLRDLARGYMFELDGALEQIPGTTKVRALMTRRSLTYLDRLGAEAGADTLLQREVANGYSKLATVLGVPVFANLGDRKGARESIDKALRLRRAILERTPDSVEDHLMLAATLSLEGQLDLNAGDPYAAANAERESLKEADWVLAHTSSPTGRQLNVAGSAALYLATAMGGSGPTPQLGDPMGAMPFLVRAQELTKREGEVRANTPGGEASNIYRFSNLALMEISMARLCWLGLEQPAQVREHFERALELLHTPGVNLANAEIRRKLTAVQADYGTWLLEQKQYSAARHYLEDTFADARQVEARDPDNLSAALDRASAQVNAGRAEALTGNVAAGFADIDDGLRRLRQQDAADGDGATSTITLTGLLILAGDTARACGRHDSGATYYKEALQRAKASAVRSESDARARIDIARAATNLQGSYKADASAAARWILQKYPNNPLAQRLLKDSQ